MRRAHLDFETRAVVDIKVGQHRYAEDENTGIWCAAVQFDDEPIQSDKCAQVALAEHIAEGGVVVAHNAGFERAIWNANYDVELKIEQQSCTMARAVSMGLPASLEALAVALRTNVTKDKEGRALMMRMCRPRKIHEDGTIEWHDTKDLPRLIEYCVQDVRTEAAIDKLLPELTPEERKVWELDQHINDRGVQIDVPMVTAAMACAEELLKRANKKIWLLTDGYVKRVTEAAKICEWIRSRGIPCESIAEGEHEGLIVCADMFDDPVIEEVIRLRAASAKAFKFPAMLNAKCKDGRVRDSLKYGATIQGRWAGSGVQFHNMKRVETDADANDVGLAVDIVRNSDIRDIARTVDRLEVLFDSPLETLSLCTRASVIAAPGHRLLGGDFSNIEGRLNAWFAGEAWKLDAFRAYDAGTGPDLYKVTAGRIIGCGPDEVTKAQRQEQGKVPELACGYQGAAGAFRKMGAKYGVRLTDEIVKRIVAQWRGENPKIVESWRILQDAAIEAVSAQGCVVSCLDGKVAYVSNGDFLFCRLPSGRVISYASPSVAWKTKVVVIDGDEVEFNRRTVSFWGMQKGWRQIDLYGGMQCAHVVSGAARDVLVSAMFRLERAGYPLVLTVHDECLSEASVGFGSADEYREILMEKDPWFAEVPIAATAWEGPRYVK
jgi:DNA polymerase